MNAETIKELMDRYNEAKAMWIATLGDKFNEAVFHAWFTKQVIGK
jgi:hypothetical protein